MSRANQNGYEPDEIEITAAMVAAGVEVLRRHLDEDRLMGNDPRLVRELLAAAIASAREPLSCGKANPL